MPDSITRGNEASRARTKAAGKLTYSHEFVESWPACVECASPIRHRPGGTDRFRQCTCPGTRWWCGMDGWRRADREDAT